jgi:hypothetical protein
MSCLANRYRSITISLAAAIGVGANALPLVSPWFALLGIAAMLLAFTQVTKVGHRAVWTGVSAAAMACVLLGVSPAPLMVAVIAASLLATAGAYALCSSVLAMHLSVLATAQAMLWGPAGNIGIEASIPAVVSALVLGLAYPRHLLVLVSAAIASILVAALVRWFHLLPEVEMALCAVPACLAAGSVGYRHRTERHIGNSLPIGVVMLLSLATWIAAPPRLFKDVYVLLPSASDMFESKLFENYIEALRFSGLDARQAATPEEVPTDSLLLIPWMTAPFAANEGVAPEWKIGELAKARRWTIVVGGEHTDLGSIASRLQRLAGRRLLNSDLTVPRGNTDDTGPLHALDVRDWPHGSIFNRGASVHVRVPWDRVLLAGDGWWVEPNLNEWLWVGDYLWNRGDRAGRVPLAMSFDSGNARWIVLGDNTPLISAQIIADPRTMLRLLEIATLLPACAKDILVVAIAAGLLLFASGPQRVLCICVATVLVSVLPVLASQFPGRELRLWRDTYVGENAFDETNFSNVLAANPDLLSERRLIRMKGEKSGRLDLPANPAVIFLRVFRDLQIGDVTVTNCWRIGSLAASEGPYLMDAQACQVDGPAKVLVGSPRAAAIFSVGEGSRQSLIVLDVGFLARNAPPGNISWLRNELTK